MTENTSAASADATPALSSMRVADLQALAANYGIKGRLRKSELIAAIEAAQAEASEGVEQLTAATTEAATAQDAEQSTAEAQTPAEDAETTTTNASDAAEQADGADEAPTGARARGRRPRRVSATVSADASEAPATEQAPTETPADADAEAPMSLDDLVLPPARGEQDDENKDENEQGERRTRKRSRGRGRRGRGNGGDSQQDDQESQNQQDSNDDDQTAGRNRNRRGRAQNGGQEQGGDNNADASNDEDEQEARRSRRNRDRKRNRRDDDVDPEIAPDDVLLPIAGILDVLDNYAFVRTSGYLPGANDVYVSLGQVKKYGLRKGDAIVGAIRPPREGEHHHGRQKYNAIVKFDTINGKTPEEIKERPEFDQLTPLYPSERLQLETAGGHVGQRLIDLFAPIGKGSRGLIVAPPKSGKSVVLERVANAIAETSPETHLMLVLVDERPEELTRMQRTIRGEVVAATFDLPAEDQTTIAELAIERAKRLVELGLDVVVLLDSITHLCRAYNLTAPVSGRILDGGVDASALYPPKRFFGAARNVENGGSLTILATAMTEAGSRMDEVILEEFRGTENLEIRLSKEIADRRIFPALDIQNSSTLMEETLLSKAEVEATWSIRRALSGTDAGSVLESVLERLESTNSNAEFVESVRQRPIQAGKVTR